MKKLLATIFISFSLISFGQEEMIKEKSRAKNSVYLELLGNGGVYSINYDRVFFGNGIMHFGGRVGFSYFSIFHSSFFTIPIEGNILLGKKDIFLELGLGRTLVLESENFNNPDLIFLRMGIRFQRKERKDGAMFRFAFTPVYKEGVFSSYMGASFGGSF